MRRSFFPLLLAALLIFLIPAGAGASVDSAGSGQATGIYVVRPGDTLASIAARHCMTWQELYNLNAAVLTNPNQIYPGMQLRVVNRCGGSSGGGSGGGVYDRGATVHAQGVVWGNTYLVVRGDTSYSIANRFGITVTALCQANGINPWFIYAGQKLDHPRTHGEWAMSARQLVVSPQPLLELPACQLCAPVELPGHAHPAADRHPDHAGTHRGAFRSRLRRRGKLCPRHSR